MSVIILSKLETRSEFAVVIVEANGSVSIFGSILVICHKNCNFVYLFYGIYFSRDILSAELIM